MLDPFTSERDYCASQYKSLIQFLYALVKLNIFRAGCRRISDYDYDL